MIPNGKTGERNENTKNIVEKEISTMEAILSLLYTDLDLSWFWVQLSSEFSYVEISFLDLVLNFDCRPKSQKTTKKAI